VAGRSLLIPFAAALAVSLLATPVAAQPEPVDVHVTIAVINFANYDPKQGSYVVDFYLVLRWNATDAPANFTAASFEMANGRATARDLQLDEFDSATGIRALWYRVQATLYSEPRYDAYPFDTQTMEIRIEDKVHPASKLRYVPNLEASGLEGQFRAAEWQIGKQSFTVTQNDYSFDEPYSQAAFVVGLHRSTLSGVLKVIVPPIAFVAVSAVSFFLLGADKIATRFALTGNMAIGAVMFHAGQAASLPSLSRLIFLDRYMLAIDVFLFASVAVTAWVAYIEMKAKDPARAKRFNLRGAIVAPLLAAGAFLLLLLV
jgi:hypothetical protein